MRNRFVAACTLFLVASLALTGCGSRITAEQIVERLQATLASTQDAHAVAKVSGTVQGFELEATVEVWEEAPNKVRAVVLESSQTELEGAVVVSDGRQAWAYQPSRNLVLAGPAGEIDLPLPQQILTSLQDLIQAVLDASDVKLAGEETLAGRETYKLTLQPKPDAEEWLVPGGGAATLWVDKAQWFVLKATFEGGALGTGMAEILDFELNQGLDDALFRFQAPEGAEVVDVTSQGPESLTLAEAMAEAPFPLLVPEYVPGDATLTEVFRAGKSYVLRYDHSPEVSFTVVQGPELAQRVPDGESQVVTVGGKTATAIGDWPGPNTFLYWTREGVTVTVAGHISLEEAIRVAESLR